MQHYILDENKNIIPANMKEYVIWSAENSRIVQQDTLFNGNLLSTVFLGFDHGYRSNQPVLFETMLFLEGSWSDQECHRYCTYEEALKGHNEMLKRFNPDDFGNAPLGKLIRQRKTVSPRKLAKKKKKI
jgi:hypothetical protein